MDHRVQSKTKCSVGITAYPDDDRRLGRHIDQRIDNLAISLEVVYQYESVMWIVADKREGYET